MVDYDVYNERRQQLIERFGGYYVDDFLSLIGKSIADVVDLIEWEDNEELSVEMGWTEA